MMEVEEKYMARCIQLARSGAGHTRPNPMVGAVVVADGRIIGEGFHRKGGGPHAEVNAIAAVKEEKLLENSTLYVSLEPCSHWGKTPPCASLILEKKIPRVVVGCLDPFPEVSGRGVQLLRQAGVEVVTGVLEKEAWELNKAFMTLQTLKRPYIILKWAQSADGFIDRIRRDASEPPVRLSSPVAQRRVHKLRSEVGAIMVGTRTALLDNPSLTVREWAGPSPLRVTIDREGCIPASFHLLDGSVPTLIFTASDMLSDAPSDVFSSRGNLHYIHSDFNRPLLPQVLAELAARKIDSLLVEGGTELLTHFLEAGLWDEARVETAPVYLEKGVKAPQVAGRPGVAVTESIPLDFALGMEGAGPELLRTMTIYSRRNL